MIHRKYKIVLYLLLLFLFLSFTSIKTFAFEGDAEEGNTTSLYAELYNSIEPDTKEVLESFGLSKIDFESILSLSPKLVIDALIHLFCLKLKYPLKLFFIYLLFFLILKFTNSFFLQTVPSSEMTGIFSTLLMILLFAKPMITVFSSAFSALQLAEAFLLNYIPIFSTLLLLHGKMLTSASYQAFMILFSNIYGMLNIKIFYPVSEIMIVLQICSGISKHSFYKEICNFIKKAGTFLLSFISTIFTGFLTLKGNLALSGDGLAIRGVKMAVGTAVPIIGGSLSDACGALFGSFSLMKNTIGIFTIIVILLLFLPSLIEIVIWQILLQITSAILESVGDKDSGALLKGIASVFSFIALIMIFSFFVFSISTGILFQTRN